MKFISFIIFYQIIFVSNQMIAQNSIGDTSIYSKLRADIIELNNKIEKDSKNVHLLNKRAILKETINDYHGAIADYTKIIELIPLSAYHYMERGKLKYKLEDYPNAIKDFDKTLEIDNKYFSAYYYRGSSKIKLGDKDGACLDWKQANQSKEAKDAINLNCN